MTNIGIAQIDALARAVRGLSDYRRWIRDQAMLRHARRQVLEEYAQVTVRLLDLDQQYWERLAVANGAVVEARRGTLSLNERQAITDRALTPFRDLFRAYEERARPLMARLPEVLEHMEDTQCRRDWVLALDSVLAGYALAAQDTVDALRAEQQPGTALRPKDGATVDPDE